jgi:hypothetical protein
MGKVVRRDARPMVPHCDGTVSNQDLHDSALRTPLCRIVKQIRHRPVDPLLGTGHDCLLKQRLELHGGVMPGNARHRISDQQIEAQLFDVHRLLLIARQLNDVFHQPSHLFDLPHQIGNELATRYLIESTRIRQHLDVGAEAGQRCS